MTKQERIGALYVRLSEYGFTCGEIAKLVRIERILHKWAEHECNGVIQRDETTGIPYAHYGRDTGGPFITSKVRDMEGSALKRLGEVIEARNKREADGEVAPYHQGDPRGCALYVVRLSEIVSKVEGGKIHYHPIEQFYNRGIAVCY